MRVRPRRATVIVDGVNIAKKHTEADAAERSRAASSTDMPIHVSQRHADRRRGKPTRVGYKSQADGTKVRICRAHGES